jgi:hypothetical protein
MAAGRRNGEGYSFKFNVSSFKDNNSKPETGNSKLKFRIGKKGCRTCKPIDTEKEKINWRVIQEQYVAFAAAKA